jgi:predicted transcriptional regulator
VIGSMVREFIQRVFNGSAEPLLVHLVEDEQLTEQDVEEIRRSIKSSKKPNRERSK